MQKPVWMNYWIARQGNSPICLHFLGRAGLAAASSPAAPLKLVREVTLSC